MSQTVREFITDYQGFDYENGEIVIVDQRRGKQIICHVKRAESYRDVEGEKLSDSAILESGGTNADYWLPGVYRREVWNWTHTFKTLLLVI